LAKLHDMYNSNPYMKEFVDVHVVVDKFNRQFNMWRNVARFFARSNYFMMLDGMEKEEILTVARPFLLKEEEKKVLTLKELFLLLISY